ncbi:MAG: aminotransferase class I/II-fold pyridoxal phosphate-dependent enzyme [Clostridia bacterium]|nr:aminotransferase class I/II-fold pyridoxal phosphate-dependent enzyme [Clostridia bacterium]
MEKLALLGGPVSKFPDKPMGDLFRWPIISKEDEEGVLDVVRNNRFSRFDITEKFQDQYAAWQGNKYAIAYCNGTMALTAAMFAIGLGVGDEIICPTKTYWGSVSQAINFGASAVFCNINEMLSMDPDDLERCITPRTKAIMVVHYYSYPADMDRIMEIANKHNLYVLEDCSHAHGATYKGRKVGTFGHVAAMSMMSFKSFAAGELGMLTTDDRTIYERAMAFGHYERNNSAYITETEDLKQYSHIALGGVKGRANQVSSVLALGQLKYYDERTKEIRKAMNYFWDLIEDLPGIRPIRVDESTGSHMGGWYEPHGAYHPEELGGLSVNRFAEAIRAQGFANCWDGGNFCLHTHPFFKNFDFYNLGKPSRIAFNDRDVREDDIYLKPSESRWCFSVPWLKKFDKEWIEAYANVYRTVIENHEQLLDADRKQQQGGRWYGTDNA